MDFSIELHMTQQYYFEMFSNQSNALIICLKISFLSDLTQNLDIEPDLSKFVKGYNVLLVL